MSHKPYNITVPYISTANFDWSFTRTGPLPWNQTVWSLLAVFTALPLWMTVELTIWVFHTFRRYSGLYFWSVLLCTWGVTLHAVGFILKFCVPECNWVFSTTLAEVGWVAMVTGFSVVLYSRLYLVVLKQRTLRWVRAMIVVDAFLFHVPTIVFQYGTSNKSSHVKYLPFMGPMERIQVVGFSIQETILSGLYISSTIRLLRDSSSFNPKIRTTIASLILIQIIVMLSDVLVIGLDYAQYFTLKAVIHSFVYALKLQLEFVILNELKAVSSAGLAAFALDASQRDSRPGAPPSREGRRWWQSKSAHDVVEIVQQRSCDESSVGMAALQKQERGVNLEAPRLHVVGVTNAADGDVERMYLGAWEPHDRM